MTSFSLMEPLHRDNVLIIVFTLLLKFLTRSTADAVERPSPVNLLRAAVMGISENTHI